MSVDTLDQGSIQSTQAPIMKFHIVFSPKIINYIVYCIALVDNRPARCRHDTHTPVSLLLRPTIKRLVDELFFHL